MSIVFVFLFAAAANVYRCETAREIVFQQTPCAAADAPVALRPESSFGDAEARSKAARPAERTVRTARPSRATGNSPKARRIDPACEAARAQRDAAYAERGNEMGFDERRRLQDRLDAACGLR